MSENTVITKKDLNLLVLLHMVVFGQCYNYAKQMNCGFAYVMAPILEKLYKGKPEERKKAYQRHLEYYLCQVSCSSLNIGIACAMEEKNATTDDFDAVSINAVKMATMNPLAAIGDSIFQATLRPLFAGIACSMVIASNYTSMLGPIMFTAMMFLASTIVRYLGITQGYKLGTRAVELIQKSGIMNLVTKLASIAACVLVGGFSYNMIKINIPYAITFEETTVSVMSILDGLLPGIPKLALLGLCYWFAAKKKASPTLMIVLALVLGVVGVYCGFLG